MDPYRKISWLGDGPPVTIQQVWDLASVTLRDVTTKLQTAEDGFFRHRNELDYTKQVSDALTKLSKEGASGVQTFKDLEQLLEKTDVRTFREDLGECRNVLAVFLTHGRQAMNDVTKMADLIFHDALRHMRNYCSIYAPLETNEDHFYQNLSNKFRECSKIRQSLNSIIYSADNDGDTQVGDMFDDDGLSFDIALNFDCDVFPLLRVVPDLFQKVTRILGLSRDWLRSDKVYISSLEREITSCRENQILTSREIESTQHNYKGVFLKLKHRGFKDKSLGSQEQENAFDYLEDLRTTKKNLRHDIVIAGKTLAKCSDQLRDLDSANSDQRWRYRGAVPVDTNRAYSAQRERLSRDIAFYSRKIYSLHQRLLRTNKKLESRRNLLNRSEAKDAVTKDSSERLKELVKKKKGLESSQEEFTVRLRILEDAHRKKTRPGLNEEVQRKRSRQEMAAKRRQSVVQRTPKTSVSELGENYVLRVFTYIRTNIGERWKDLTRSLQYSPPKDVAEIDGDIRDIEYENRGQLREQAYQALLRWQRHNGQKTSVASLVATLRRMKENRIADGIDMLGKEN